LDQELKGLLSYVKCAGWVLIWAEVRWRVGWVVVPQSHFWRCEKSGEGLFLLERSQLLDAAVDIVKNHTADTLGFDHEKRCGSPELVEAIVQKGI